MRNVVAACLTGYLGLMASAPAAAATITVAEATWIVEGDTCFVDTPEDCLSVFSLQYLWIDPANAAAPPTDLRGDIAAGASAPLPAIGSFGPVDAATPIDAFSLPGLFDLAEVTLFFTLSAPVTLGPQLLVGDLFDANGAPDLLGRFAIFEFEVDDPPNSVPEPGPLVLLLLALPLLWALRRRAAPAFVRRRSSLR